MLTIENHVFAWHQDLGIDDTRAAELYKTNPNDPQIILWQNAMQEQIYQDKTVCLEVSFVRTTQSTIDNCLYLIEKITLPNCEAHTNVKIQELKSMLRHKEKEKVFRK